MEFKKLVSFCSSLISKLTYRAHYNNTDGRPLLITIDRWLRKLELLKLKMSCQKLSRQSLHLVLNEGRGLYSLRHMDVSKLFYPSTAQALEAEAKAKKKTNGIYGLGGIIGYVEGHTNIYNTEFRSFMTMPALNSPKGPNCMAAHITRTPAHARTNRAALKCLLTTLWPVGEWQWRALPSPPFFDDLEYKAYAIADGTRICVSSATETYSFDTVTLEWSKTGDWVLPFHTKAEYVPELDLWLGLSASSPSDLCALDLSTAAIDSCDVAPVVQHIGLDVDLPKDWSLKSRTLVNLGSGRFCLAMFFHTADAQDGPQVVVFTGVDVVPCGDNQQGERTLRRIKHKSKCLVTDRIQYVL
ncbi:hypothetical protein C2845_PM09G14610 [Panicum miliaceum]|uniref:Uncharacterized protein n=1 Tax=Panicum miliaceum TaxID=4540 RepID=A0A3L6RZI8_PANMI|nr:hypothetical protein C2845_PM09G14610 [Panicum miliaceum]